MGFTVVKNNCDIRVREEISDYKPRTVKSGWRVAVTKVTVISHWT